MHFEGALLKEQNTTFAIVVVRREVLNNDLQTSSARNQFSRYFPGVPLILMAQDSRGVPTYQGRIDIVRFLANIDPSRIPWKRYTFN
jgi:hypothetical protein